MASSGGIVSLKLCTSPKNLESALFRVQKGTILRFCVSARLAACGGVSALLFNQAVRPDVRFSRHEFHEVVLKRGDDGVWCGDEELHTAGSYCYKYTYRRQQKPGESTTDETVEQSGYVVVEPSLLRQDGSRLMLDGITMQTVMTPMLSSMSSWWGQLRVAVESGYNMLHFSPIQVLGESHSAYSIGDQLVLLDDLRSEPIHDDEPKRLVTQSSVGPLSGKMLVDIGIGDVHKLVKKMHREWGMFSAVDVVWNHTAADSTWLRQHPEAGYNLDNSPHLKPAYELNQAILEFSNEVSEGKWEHRGVRAKIQSGEDLQRMSDILLYTVLPQLQLWEYFCTDVDEQVEVFRRLVSTKTVEAWRVSDPNQHLALIQDEHYRRNCCTVDMGMAIQLLFDRDMKGAGLEEHIDRACRDFADTLSWLNDQKRLEVESDVFAEAVGNSMANVKYEFLEDNGPRRSAVTVDWPIVPSYFFHLDGSGTLSDGELLNSKHTSRVLAHNGWVMNADPLSNFALATSQVYLRRQLIPWGDSCKLRYGNKPSDSPWLWEHMVEYTRQMAWVFHGFRIDNCHNTPLHVAEAFLDEARLVRPDLYVVAELFTNSEEIDNIFINHLGINSLIREAANAHESRELGRMVYRYGGEAVGSFIPRPGVRELRPSIAHAVLVDLTHDNESLIQVRSVYDALPNSALVAMACCATGSTRGYDELVQNKIGVVSGGKIYQSWRESDNTDGLTSADGIIAAKRALNHLHIWLAEHHYTQVYVDQVSNDIVAVTRHNPVTHESVLLVAHTAFRPPPPDEEPTEEHTGVTGHVPPLCVEGDIDEVIFEGQILRRGEKSARISCPAHGFITGLLDYTVHMQEHIPIEQSNFCRPVQRDGNLEAHFRHFPPGSVVIFKTSLTMEASYAVQQVSRCLGLDVDSANKTTSLAQLSEELECVIQQLSLTALNKVLYRCDAEERDDGNGSAVYDVPGYGQLPYGGLQGIMSLLDNVQRANDLGHPLCDNIRSGDWLAEYLSSRLLHHDDTALLGKELVSVFATLSALPRYLLPTYFERLLFTIHRRLIDRAVEQMSSFVRYGSPFLQKLALGSVQLYGIVKSSQMPDFSPDIFQSLPPEIDPRCSFAAGLPHFATGSMRCWGRDTFIALRGLFMVTGRLHEARLIILAFAGCLRHGLLPNLLGGGPGARFNCRDAPWWWLQAVQDFCSFAGSTDIIHNPVSRLFPTDESPALEAGQHVQPVHEIIHEILQRHFEGIDFRERNAGEQLDRNMKANGFHVTAGVDLTTGFPHGGSAFNCGTWMDKVGESDRAGNRGVPATPRDGSAVEIVALCKSALRWLTQLCSQGVFPHNTVNCSRDGADIVMTFAEWDGLIQQNFERRFWVPEEAEDDYKREGDDAKFIHRRGIYKDSVGASHRFADFQLRPNFPIAMVVAPELFSRENARTALGKVEHLLSGPLGLATLDPKDWAYNGVYDNGLDTDNKNTARGFNYHQGPEWLWVKGYFLRAMLCFACSTDADRQCVYGMLADPQETLDNSPWHGLPELTNANGAECKDSCPVQAWSMSSLLDFLYDFHMLTQQLV